MKKTIFILLTFLAVTVSLKAQFKLTINGFKSEKDLEKGYVVYEFADEKKDDLMKNVNDLILQSFNSMTETSVYRSSTDAITIKAFGQKLITLNSLNYDINFRFEVAFKDGRIKIDIPFFKCHSQEKDKIYKLKLSAPDSFYGNTVIIGLFDKDGQPIHISTINELETFFNEITNNIKDSIKNKKNDDDW